MNTELTGNQQTDACVKADEYEFDWVARCLVELHGKGVINYDELLTLTDDLLTNS